MCFHLTYVLTIMYHTLINNEPQFGMAKNSSGRGYTIDAFPIGAKYLVPNLQTIETCVHLYWSLVTTGTIVFHCLIN